MIKESFMKDSIDSLFKILMYKIARADAHSYIFYDLLNTFEYLLYDYFEVR